MYLCKVLGSLLSAQYARAIVTIHGDSRLSSPSQQLRLVSFCVGGLTTTWNYIVTADELYARCCILRVMEPSDRAW